MTSYREAGVDLAGADRHVSSIEPLVTSTWTDAVVGAFGGFSAGVRVPEDVPNPVLMMTTDGVGTKIDIARRAGSWDWIGHDLVAMCVDDLAVTGARSIGFVDYMAVGALSHERDRAIVSSIADACRLANCPLLGGETAEHPDVMAPEAVDLAGAALGVVAADHVLGPDRVGPGDVVLGLHSPNLRSNGFSLVRSAMGEAVVDHADRLLEPSVIYAPHVLETVSSVAGVRSAAHITGGGLPVNLRRALPSGMSVVVDRSAWEPPEVFGLIQSFGVDEEEMWATFNMGIGFCLIVSDDSVDSVSEMLVEHEPSVIGVVEPGGEVRLS